MTTLARIVTYSATVALLSSAPALAQKVTYDAVRNQIFSQLRTFSIKQTPPEAVKASRTTAYDSPIVKQNTDAAVAAQLQARGLTRDDVNPDVYVTTRRSFQTEYYGYGWPGGGYGYGSYYLEPQVVGTLVVDINDAKTGELLWRGLSERDMHPTSSPEHRLKRINREVSKIFRKYPSGIVATSGSDIAITTDH